MLYISGLGFALFIVAGQALYNAAVHKVGFELNLDFLLSKRLLDLLLSWQFLLGMALFLTATGINLWMYTRYEFSSVQAVVVPLVLMFSFVAGYWFFKDEISVVNMIGFFVLIAGVILATIR